MTKESKYLKLDIFHYLSSQSKISIHRQKRKLPSNVQKILAGFKFQNVTTYLLKNYTNSINFLFNAD